MQNLQKNSSCSQIFGWQPVLGVSGLEMRSSGTNPVTFFGAQSSLGGHNFRLGGHKRWFGGHGSRNSPHRTGPVTIVMIVAEVCVYNTEKLLKHASVNFVSNTGVQPIVWIFFRLLLSTACWVIYTLFQVIVFFSILIHHLQTQICNACAMKITLHNVDKMSAEVQQRMCF